MQSSPLLQLLTFRGRMPRLPYFLTGVILVFIKFGVDTAIAHHFGQPWRITNYFLPPANITIFTLSGPLRPMYLALWAAAVPFFWIGVSLTLARLRDAGSGAAWLVLFFVPLLNLVFLLVLSTAPSRPLTTMPVPQERQPRFAIQPTTAGIVLATVTGVAMVLVSTRVFALYAWGLFLGVPVMIGFIAGWFYNAAASRSAAETSGISIGACSLVGLALIGLHTEGLICLLMALPLALPFSIAGGLIARSMLLRRHTLARTQSGLACVAALPLLLLGEHTAQLEPPTLPVVTRIVVNAPVHDVWQNVIAFPQLAPPTDPLFRTGIAYPIGATISGTGVGAVRRCRFSTGDFVEPITTWDTDHLLAFSVAEEPPSLREIGFGSATLHTPHIDRNYFRSRRGQFKLTALDAHHTLLEGTTWYQDYFWPQVYWRPISDAIVHRIHLRVLRHVKAMAEQQYRQVAATAPHTQTATVR